MNFSRPVPEKEESPVCFQIEPLSKASDHSARMPAKHFWPRKVTFLGRTTLRSELN
jgi:hypothetical protein